ncbi:MATE family efflux transporter [Candidatus Uabimicrobium sp. HlEnr_7]|uniref:MATE family efflux transporter n=1 Tax=Candidatus Uabimicrobium helgolandensis TaxID=3095367 RepID=UPI003558776F
MNNLTKEFVASFKFALPIVLTQCGFLCFSVVDLYMVSRIDLIAIGGLGNANSLFWPVFMALCGVVYAMDALASQSSGAGRDSHLVNLLFQGGILGAILSTLTLGIFAIIYLNFEAITANTELLVYSKNYFFIVALSAPLLLFFTVFQRYWQAQGVTKPLLFIVVIANILNFAVNEILIFGRLGFPALGIKGAAISTTTSRFFMIFLVVILTYLKLRNTEKPRLSINTKILRQMFAIGIPIGLMLFFEVSVFAIATRFATRISAEATSVHHIGIVLISIFYTIPMGISSAAAYRVGFFIGKDQFGYAKKIGYIAIFSSAVVMTGIAAILYYNTDAVLRLFTSDMRIIQIGTPILLWITISLLFDGTQCSVAGCLRGGARTQLSSFTALICHYLIGLPLAYYLCFTCGKGLLGLWIGLTVGLISISIILFGYWCLLPAEKLIYTKK